MDTSLRRARTVTAALPRAALLALALAAAACSPDGGGADAGPTTTAAATTSSSPATSAPAGATTTTAAAGRLIEVRVTGGKVQTGERRARVRLGETVRLVVTVDTADEVHVHGYDLEQAARAGSPVTFEFTADKPGVFEVELHEAGLKLLELQVQ